jgi:glycine oxidase
VRYSYSTDVLIAGGGVIGCSIAYYLRKAGVEVLVLERGEIGAQASSAAAGLLAPLRPFAKREDPYMRLLFASLALFPALADELAEITGISIEWERTGTLRLISEGKREAATRWAESWTSAGMEVTWLSPEEVESREPLLAAGAGPALCVPGESQVRASRVVQAFAQAASALGATLLSQQEMVGVSQSHGRVTGVTTARGDEIACGHLVVATGAWSAACSALLDFSLPVSPRRGQLLSLRQPDHAPLRHIVFADGIYLAPKKGGTLLVGAKDDEVGFDAGVTADGLHWLIEKASSVAPALGRARVESFWAGLRPKTPDRHPILGRAPGLSNVTIATGHNGFGVALSPLTGQAISEQVMTGRTSEWIRPYAPDRFALTSAAGVTSQGAARPVSVTS